MENDSCLYLSLSLSLSGVYLYGEKVKVGGDG
jgi:hypothetical protein